jgi:hypothetical protein
LTLRGRSKKEKDKKDDWAWLSESSYAIVSNLPPQSVTDQARKYLDPNDNIYVITLKRPYWGWGPEDVNKWLERNLPSLGVFGGRP